MSITLDTEKILLRRCDQQMFSIPDHLPTFCSELIYKETDSQQCSLKVDSAVDVTVMLKEQNKKRVIRPSSQTLVHAGSQTRGANPEHNATSRTKTIAPADTQGEKPTEPACAGVREASDVLMWVPCLRY